MNYWSMTASSKHYVVHVLGISYRRIRREPTVMRSCRLNLFTNWGKAADLVLLKKKKISWRPGTDRCGLKALRNAEEKVCVTVCLRELTPDFKKCMKNTGFFFLHTEKKEQTVPRMPGENTVQIMGGRREQIREKAVCSSGLQGNSSTDSQVRELKEK